MDAAGVGLRPAPDLVPRLTAMWPPRQAARLDGYRTVPVDGVRLLDAAWLGPRTAVAVVGDSHAAYGTLPLVVEDDGIDVARSGSGVSALLVEALGQLPPPRHMDQGDVRQGRGFGIRSIGRFEPGAGLERALGTDQTNTSVVIDERVIVKWRTALAVRSGRSLLLRRHLREVDFASMAPLLGALTWVSPDGDEVLLADVDGFLPDAVDGWDAAIADLCAVMEGTSADGLGMAHAFGRVAADLHAALATPSSVIPAPLGMCAADEIDAWRRSGLELVDQAVAMDGDGADIVRAASDRLRQAIGSLADIPTTANQPIHGDLHVGQVVHWPGGLAVIDFDGAPGRDGTGRGADALERRPAERDVAQLLCSLDLLANVVDTRTEGRHRDRLRAWAGDAKEAFLEAYRSHRMTGGGSPALDERLIAPFQAEQLCRELVYAADVLPRWRYAPIGVLRWLVAESSA